MPNHRWVIYSTQQKETENQTHDLGITIRYEYRSQGYEASREVLIGTEKTWG